MTALLLLAALLSGLCWAGGRAAFITSGTSTAMSASMTMPVHPTVTTALVIAMIDNFSTASSARPCWAFSS